MDLPLSLNEPRALLLLLTIPPVVFVGMLSARARARDRGRIVTSTVIRGLILLLITLAVAGMQWITTGGPLNVVFLVDRSASMTQASRDASLQYVRKAIASMGPDDRAAVVLFGEDAVVDRALSADTQWDFAGQEPPGIATNIAGAMQMATALFPEGGSRRMVLLSDGLETVGQARNIARDLGGQGVQLSVVPLGVESKGEVSVDRVLAPNSVPGGQQAQVRVIVRSNTDRAATVSLFDGDTLIGRQDVQVKVGDNAATFTYDAKLQGFHTLRARVDSVDDQFAQNNEADGFTIVKKPPTVLILAGTPDDGKPLQQALQASGITADVRSPDALPQSQDTLGTYDAVVLANVSAQAIGLDGQQVLQSFVRDLGHGLVMVGGETSYGAGGYMRSPLEEVMPVTMDVRSSQERASLAITFVVDKSGSMGRCHCGGQQQFDPSMRTEFGDSKIEIVKDAIARATALLNSSDEVGVVAFDTQPHWVAPLAPLGQLGESHLAQLLQPMNADGATAMQTGLNAAVDALQQSNAKLKHIILLSDGWTQQGDFRSVQDRLAQDKITMSSVGVGDGASDMLKTLAEQGGGRYYSAQDDKKVPDILLKETVQLAGSYFVEKAFRPTLARGSPILTGIDTDNLPQLLGYNASTLKPDADLLLKSPDGDPVLAAWQYGLGRSVAWTSDAKGRWAINWVQWPQFARFVGQMVSWTLPTQSTAGLDTSFSLQPAVSGSGQDVAVRIDSANSDGTARDSLDTSVTITGTGQLTTSVQILERSPGVYDGTAQGLGQGVYRVLVSQRDPTTDSIVAREETGFVVPYPSEFRLAPGQAQQGQALLGDVAQLGGGRQLDITHPEAAFIHDLSSLPRHVPIWPWLLLAAVILFPVDVAVRRISVGPRELLYLLRRRSA